MGEKLATNCLASFAAIGKRIPNDSYNNVCVVSGMNDNAFGGSMSHYGAVDQDVDIDVRYGGGVIRRIGEVDVCLKSERRRRSIDNREIPHFEVEFLED